MANNKLEVKSGTLKLPPGASTSDGSLGEIRMDGSGNPERHNGSSWVSLASGTAASGISYSNTTSGLTATDVQAAIDEVEGRLDTAETNISNKVTGPASAADYNLASFDGTTGKLVRDSGVAINATFDMSGINDLAMTGDLDASDALVVDLANTNTASTVTVGGGNGGNAINIGTGTGANVINIGGANSTINMTGTVNNQNVTNLDVDDKLITINKGGAAASGGVSGIEVEENAVITGYVETSADRNSWAFKAPNTNGVATLTPGASADDVVLRQATQTLTGKTIDGDDNTVQDLALTSLKTVLADASKFIVRDASGIPISNTKAVPSGVVVGTTDAQVLTAKDIDGGTASDTSRITIPKNTTSNLNALTRKEATIVYDTDTNTLKYDDGATLNEIGSGSGAGRVNFLIGDDTNFKNSVGNYTTFDEGAVSTPVDLTGGSASVVSAARSTAFDSTGGLRISHSAADGQGEGVTVPITTALESKYLSSVMDIEFTYKSSSGYADDKLEVWVYDVTNATLIQPSNYKIKASTVPSKFKAQFQTSSNGTSYRLGFFCPNTTATAYDLDIDDVVVGPSIYNYGTPGYDPKDYTPTFSNLGTGSVNITYFKHSRRGKYCRIDFKVNKDASAGTGSGNVKFTLPSGVTPDLSGSGIVGYCSGGFSANINPVIYWQSGDSTNLYFIQNDGTYIIGSEWPANQQIEGWLEFPVSGWSSSVQMSSEADQRECSARYSTGAGQAITNGSTSIIDFGTKTYDTHGAVTTGASWKFTAQTSGRYRLRMAALHQAAATTFEYRLYKNGSQVSTLYRNITSNQNQVNASDTVDLLANDYIDVRLNNSSGGTITLNTSTSECHVTIEKIQGPSAIGATETIACRYTATDGQSISNTTETTLIMPTKVIDTHNAYNTSNGRFTAPASGIYQVNASIMFASTAVDTTPMFIRLRKNGVDYQMLFRLTAKDMDTANENIYLSGKPALVQLNAGDYVEIIVYQSTGGSLAITTTSTYNSTEVIRVGI